MSRTISKRQALRLELAAGIDIDVHNVLANHGVHKMPRFMAITPIDLDRYTVKFFGVAPVQWSDFRQYHLSDVVWRDMSFEDMDILRDVIPSIMYC